MDLVGGLTGLGYEALGVARSGSEAVRMTEQSAPDLVLIDAQMKGALDGMAAGREIHRTARIPVVYLTTYVDDEILTRSNTSGPFGFLFRPFRTDELNAMITIGIAPTRNRSGFIQSP